MFPTFTLKALSGWILYYFEKFPSIWDISVLSDTTQCFKFIWYFPAPALESIIFPKSLSSLYWRIETKIWALVLSLWLECHCFKPFQWTELGNTCIYSNICTHIYLHFRIYYTYIICVCERELSMQNVCICEKDTHTLNHEFLLIISDSKHYRSFYHCPFPYL